MACSAQSGHLWDAGTNGPLGNMNDLGQSIEDNTKVPPQVGQEKTNLRRQTSLYAIRRQLKSLNRKINQHLDLLDKEKETRSASETETTTKTETKTMKDNDIYSECLGEGDRGMKVLCEPAGSMRTTYCKQVGDNNVIINLKMCSNRCQIVDEKGTVQPLDSNGEFWLEIRRRKRGSTTSTSSSCRSSSSSDSSNDSGPSGPSGPSGKVPNPTPHVVKPEPYLDDGNARFPQEAFFQLDSSENNGGFVSYVEPRWPLDACRPEAVEHHDSFDTVLLDNSHNEGDPLYANIRVDEKNDAILMKMEAPPGGRRLTEFQSVDECEPVQRALGHQRVIDFLKKGDDSFDVDMSVIGWEYEQEDLYTNSEALRSNMGLYSNPASCTENKPERPLRPTGNREPTENSENYDYVDEVNIPDRKSSGEGLTKPPALPPRKTHHNGHDEPVSQSVFFDDDIDVNEKHCNGKPDTPSKLSKPGRKQIPPPPSGPDASSPRHQTNHTGNSPHLSRSISDTGSNPHVSRSTSDTGSNPHVSRSTSDTGSNPHVSRSTSDTGSRLCAPWYLGDITSDRAKQLLDGKCNGSFLVRDTTGDHEFTLEFVDSGSSRRLRIYKSNDKYHLEKGSSKRFKEFDSVEDLIEAAMKSGIEVRDSATNTWRTIRITPVDRSR